MRYMLLLRPESKGIDPSLLRLYSDSGTIIPVFTSRLNVERFVERLGESVYPGGIYLTLDLDADSKGDLINNLKKTGIFPDTRFIFDTEQGFEQLLNSIKEDP